VSRPAKDVVDQRGGGQDRRPGVEREAVLVKDRGAAPGLIALLEDGDLVSLALKTDGRGESPEARADDDDLHPPDDRRQTADSRLRGGRPRATIARKNLMRDPVRVPS
jgi:hypothetical protein